MKNKEKYAKEIFDIACDGCTFGVLKSSNKIVKCEDVDECGKCLFSGHDCNRGTRQWCEEEYRSDVKISRKDRGFLDFIDDDYKYIARDKTANIFAYEQKPQKDLSYWACAPLISLRAFDIDFPMIKWEDEEPWAIKDLKRLEVIDSYE